MKRTISILFLVFGICALSNISEAQKRESKASLVTDAMARKVAYAAKYGNNSIRVHMYNDFCSGNAIRYSPYEYDKILENIINNKDKVEEFICQVFYGWGVEEYGYNYFKTIGFTVAEFDVAVNIYNKRKEQSEREAAEKKRLADIEATEKAKQHKLQQIESDKKTLGNWKKNGKDTLPVGQDGVTSPKLVFNAGGQSVCIEPNNEEQSIDSERDETRRYVVGKIERSPKFEFIVGENNDITYVDKDLWERKLDLTTVNFQALTPGSIYLEGLDTTIIIPTKNTYQIIIIYDAIRQTPTTFQGIILKDKKGNCKFENRSVLRGWLYTYYRFNKNEIGFTIDEEDSFIEYITNRLCERLKTEQGKKFKVSFEIIGARKIRHYVNLREVDSYYQDKCNVGINSIEKIK